VGFVEGVVSDFREFREWLRNWLFYRRQAFKMGLAIRLADIKQRAFNRQYHVMLLVLPTGEKLTSVSRRDIQLFKRKKWLPKKMGMVELERSIFYSTPVNRNNTSTPEDRRRAKEKYMRYARKKTYLFRQIFSCKLRVAGAGGLRN
jgi:hypothetical protein